MTDTDCAHEFSYWSGEVRICHACEAALEHRNVAPSRLAMAEIIHNARWPTDRRLAITPFADEDRNGREYCFRIADAVLTSGVAQRAPVAWRWRTLPKFSEDAADREWELTQTAPNFINPHHHEVEPLYALTSTECGEGK